MKKVYRKRRDYLIGLLGSSFPGIILIFGVSAGMYIVAEFEEISFSQETMERVRTTRVGVVPVEKHAIIKGKRPGQIGIWYAHLAPEHLHEGVARLRRTLKR